MIAPPPPNPPVNYLYYGNNLDILREKIASNSVDLCYIDPPFNSNRNYFQIYNNQGSEDKAQAKAFEDTWGWGDEAIRGLDEITQPNNKRFTERTVALIKGLLEVLGEGDLLAYLIHMTLRIVEIQRVLKPTGSFYLHCDPTASHYLKLICDSAFCPYAGNLKNEIIWYYHNRWTSGKRAFQRLHDTIFFYVKKLDRNTVFNVQYQPYAQSMQEQFDKKGFVKRSSPKKGDYVSTPQQGVAMHDVWMLSFIHSQSKERLGYQTQKPEALLERIIKASSNEGDTVLDAYCGCGTTVAVAQRLKRHWVGIDITYQSISLILKRLQDTYKDNWKAIEANLHLDGIPRDLESVEALIHRKDDKTRKEFEKWAVLAYSDNQARINDKKGADGGIDGTAEFAIDNQVNGKIVFQVKSGKVDQKTIKELNHDRQRVGAEFGFLITHQPPNKNMLKEAKTVGKYKHPSFNQESDRIQIITTQEILDGKRLDLPMRSLSLNPAKSAEAYIASDQQLGLSGIK